MSRLDFVLGYEAALQSVRTSLNASSHCLPSTWPEGRTVLETEQLGEPFVRASGIDAAVFHQGGCNFMAIPYGYPCSCGADAALNRLAIEFAEVLDQYGRPQ